MMSSKIIVPNEDLMKEVSERVKSGQQVTIPVKGNSMLPFIAGDSDKVLIASFGYLKKGDIVLAKTRIKSYVVHRITNIRGTELTLMGDGNLYEAEICCTEDVIGRVAAVIRGKNIISCSAWQVRYLARIWSILLPVRKYLLRIYFLIRKSKKTRNVSI